MERCARFWAKKIQEFRFTLIKKYVLEFIHVQDSAITRQFEAKS